jgi:hypothetical protein
VPGAGAGLTRVTTTTVTGRATVDGHQDGHIDGQLESQRESEEDGGTGATFVGRRLHLVMDDLTPRQARVDLLHEVVDLLEGAGVRPFLVKGARFPGATVGVLDEDRPAALKALSGGLDPTALHLQEVYRGVQEQPVHTASVARMLAVPERCDVIRLGRLHARADHSLRYGMEYGVTVEFWRRSEEDPESYLAPTPNAAANLVHESRLTRTTVEHEGEQWPGVSAFGVALGEVTFPVDVVYTWVDGADPAWRERMALARAQEEGTAYHPQAHSENRFVSRDELRYSLRSLHMYAPWVRHVYLVTDQQVPTWLDPDAEGITVVDHRDIYRDPSVLPVFNSSAIITQLHHIEGLSEHYLYLNDDMFFGNDVRPEDFWHGSGVAKIFPSKQTRPFGDSHEGDAPHINITKNIRRLLEDDLGVSISLAIRHTPYPQIRSVNEEIEQRYAEVVAATAGRRFRHHTDVALDQLFHYYAQATGRAVPATISYDYANIGAASSASRLRRLLASRSRSVFCLNDAPEPGVPAMEPDELVSFLASYFPVASPYERVGVTGTQVTVDHGSQQ